LRKTFARIAPHTVKKIVSDGLGAGPTAIATAKSIRIGA
jgi:hypothetical protein